MEYESVETVHEDGYLDDVFFHALTSRAASHAHITCYTAHFITGKGSANDWMLSSEPLATSLRKNQPLYP
jgi:hypothetical protein